MDVYKEWLGIPDGQRPPDHYTLLRLVQFEDNDERVRRNYTKLNAHVRKYATGQYSKESQELLNELAKAMLCLTDKERKEDYDRSLGREPDKKPGAVEQQTLLETLVAGGTISDDQAQEAESFADARGLSMRDAVVQMKIADAETATQAFAQELGYSYIDLANTIPDDSILDKCPRSLVKRHQIIPLFIDDDVLLVACVHEPTPDLEEELRLRYNVPMRPVMATPLAVNQAIAKYYAPGARDEAAQDEATPAKTKTKKKKEKTKKAKAKSAAQPAAEESSEDAYQKKLTGILIMCWAVIGCVVIDNYLLKPYVFKSVWPFYLTLIIPPVVIFWVIKFYWK